jgi:hypothetical protein
MLGPNASRCESLSNWKEEQLMKPGADMLKRLILFLLILTAMGKHGQIALADMTIRRIPPASAPPPTPFEMMTQRFQERRIGFKPTDPWREIDGQKLKVAGSGWYQFVGKIVEVQPRGIRVSGWYGDPMVWPGKDAEMTFVGSAQDYTSGTGILPLPNLVEFFVRNYPYSVSDGTFILWEHNRVAAGAETFTYTTVAGGNRTLQCLDYGTVTAAPPPIPPTPEQIEAQKKQKAAMEVRTLKWQRQLAEKGDPYGLYRMGERYLNGTGVEKDEVKAKGLLRRAADGGNIQAKLLLESMPKSPPAEK